MDVFIRCNKTIHMLSPQTLSFWGELVWNRLREKKILLADWKEILNAHNNWTERNATQFVLCSFLFFNFIEQKFQIEKWNLRKEV